MAEGTPRTWTLLGGDMLEGFPIIPPRIEPDGPVIHMRERVEVIEAEPVLDLLERLLAERDQNCEIAVGLAERVNRELQDSPEQAQGMPVFVLKAKDDLAEVAVDRYAERCREIGLESQACEAEAALEEFMLWRRAHSELCKLPDHKHVPVAEQMSAPAEPTETQLRDAARLSDCLRECELITDGDYNARGEMEVCEDMARAALADSPVAADGPTAKDIDFMARSARLRGWIEGWQCATLTPEGDPRPLAEVREAVRLAGFPDEMVAVVLRELAAPVAVAEATEGEEQ